MADWSDLGAALAGPSEKAYQEGRALGAKTEEALAAARERVNANAAKERSREVFRAAGVDERIADLMSNAMLSGGNPGDPIQAMLKNQEFGFRQQMGDPNVPLDIGQRAALGVASGPVEPIYKVGNRAFNKFETPENVEDLGAVFGGGDIGSSSFIQSARAFGLLNPDGSISPENRALAYEILRNTDKAFDVGGVPMIRSGNPFGAPGGAVQPALRVPGAPPQGAQAAGPTPAASAPAVTPLAGVDQVASNAAAIASATEQGQLQAKAAAGLPDTLADIGKMRANITNLLGQPGFNTIYGNWQGTAPGQLVTGLASQDAENARAALSQLDAQSFGISIQKMVGLGQLSNAEGLKITQAFTRATNPRISEAEARQAWQEVLDGLTAAESRAQAKATAAPTLPGAAAPAAPDAGGWQTINGVRIRVKPQ